MIQGVTRQRLRQARPELGLESGARMSWREDGTRQRGAKLRKLLRQRARRRKWAEVTGQ
jgi:hypothetical protein